jgi:crotonobetainyl-CoA:carnitine CoA-transferase CaiB-like acyl-CoA transferase
MLDSIVTSQMQEFSIFTVGHKPQRRSAEPHGHCYVRAPYGVFETADNYITLSPRSLPILGKALGVPEFETMDQERDGYSTPQRDFIVRKTREKLLEKTTKEWLEIFDRAGVRAVPVYGYQDVVDDPQIAHNGTFIEYDHPSEGRVKVPGYPYKLSRSPCAIFRPTPLTGQHTKEILKDIGVSEAEIAAFEARGVIACYNGPSAK